MKLLYYIFVLFLIAISGIVQLQSNLVTSKVIFYTSKNKTEESSIFSIHRRKCPYAMDHLGRCRNVSKCSNITIICYRIEFNQLLFTVCISEAVDEIGSCQRKPPNASIQTRNCKSDKLQCFYDIGNLFCYYV